MGEGQTKLYMDQVRRMTPDTMLSLGITALITTIPLLSTHVQVAFALGGVCLTVVAWIKRCRASASVGIFFTACLAAVFAGVSFSQIFLRGNCNSPTGRGLRHTACTWVSAWSTRRGVSHDLRVAYGPY